MLKHSQSISIALYKSGALIARHMKHVAPQVHLLLEAAGLYFRHHFFKKLQAKQRLIILSIINLKERG